MKDRATNEKANGAQPAGFSKRTTNTRDFTGKSTAKKAQYGRILQMLLHGEKSTIELRRGGVMMPAARVKEMREKLGYNIVRVALRDMWDEWGFKHPRTAVYTLLDEPMEP